ncbi:MAG: DNA-directed RNA polymerase subunit alpha C-terminal domain-containing protein [Bacteroidota bacterium]|nr:DNA-directed RNA polymerase subunit alpha C-terminal domain-containing protein [Bacteroidota bacterium]
MKKQVTPKQPITPLDELNDWQTWLKQILTPREFVAFCHYYETLNIEQTRIRLKISYRTCLARIKNSLKKIKKFLKLCYEIETKAELYVLSKKHFLNLPIRRLGISKRLYNILRSVDIKYTWDITHHHRTHDLRNLKGFGESSLIELQTIFEKHGCLHMLE